MKKAYSKNYDIFISYRREHGAETAKHLRDILVGKGYRVFFDTDSLRNGNFDTALFDVIKNCKDFIIILQPGTLDRCVNEGDWVRMELSCALQNNKNVIPILGSDFKFPETLPEDINSVRYKNGIKVVLMYFDAVVEKLESFLESTPVIKTRRNILLGIAAVGIAAVCASAFLIPRNNTRTEPPAASAETAAAPAPSPETTPEPAPSVAESAEDAAKTEETAEESPAGAAETAAEETVAESAPSENPSETRSLLKEEWFDKNSWDKAGDWPVFGSGFTRKEIRSVTFLSANSSAPEDAWDISRDGDRSCLAWVTGGTGNRSLFISGEGRIVAPEDCTGMFCGYENASSIVFGDVLDTSEVRSAASLFMGCRELKALDLSGFDTSAAADGSFMFFGCTQLQDLDVTSFDTSHMTDMQAMFFGCGSLRKLDVSGFDTSSARDLNNMFAGCSSLEELDVRGFDTSAAANLEAMFFNCAGLPELDLGGFDTSAAVSMNKMFYSCRKLTEIDLGTFNFSAAADLREMFSECAGLTSLKLNALPSEPAAQTGGMFAGCTALADVYYIGSEDGPEVSLLEEELPAAAQLHFEPEE